MKRALLSFIIVFITLALSAQRVAEDTYWFYFTDKDNNGYSISQPEEFLSMRSIDRRAWQGLPIDYSDLPVSIQYADSLRSLQLNVLFTSKWLNGVLIESSDKELIDTLCKLSFIDSLPWEPESDDLYFPDIPSGSRFHEPLSSPPAYKYGNSFEQLDQLNLPLLHEKGYTGKGVLLAVLDAGFSDLPELPAFQTIIESGQILKTKNFVDKSSGVYNSHTHGTNVTSLIAANWPDTLMGAAPEVDLLLATTENAVSETRIEEYSWIEAAEWADSLGADVLNTSLGYTTFDDSTTDYSFRDMDGKTAHISIANGMTAAKGMISVCSAGNSGNDSWYYIGAPADAFNIISVGAVDNKGIIASFSSRGPTYDHRIKPEVSGMGSRAWVQATDGSASQGSGTSFSSPIIAGATTVLWQAYPSLTAMELMRWIIESGNRSDFPTVDYGYGIPSYRAAYYAITSTDVKFTDSDINVYPNPFSTHLTIDIPFSHTQNFTVLIYDIQGRVIYTDEAAVPGRLMIPESIQSGIYILEIRNTNDRFRTRIIKY